MNGKYALALILALQVSMSLCEIPAPEQELVDKYTLLKTTFYKRLLTAYGKLQAAAAPAIERAGDSDQGQAVKTFLGDVQSRPEFQAFVKVATGVGEEAAPLVDTARTNILGLYGSYLRPHIGTHLDNAINNLKVYLDQLLPTE